MVSQIPVIDLFAGPGGLGEGFSSFSSGDLQFKIALSIEMDSAAHQTLQLRAFYRQFNNPPKEYFDYLNGKISREELFDAFPEERDRAIEEAWHHELKEGDIDSVKARARKALKGFSIRDCVMIGGPPCQAYSMAGRSRMKSVKPDFEDDPRFFLYRHYLRLMAHIKPAVFVMENVKGLTSAIVRGKHIFPQIISELAVPGQVVKQLDDLKRAPSTVEYNIYSLVKNIDNSGGPNTSKNELLAGEYVIKAEDYGIPQKRHRVILLGVRKDLDPSLANLLVKQKNPVTVLDVLDGLPELRSSVTKRPKTVEAWHDVMQEGIDDGAFKAVDEKVYAKIKAIVAEKKIACGTGAVRLKGKTDEPAALNSWFRKNCKQLDVVLNHESKRHMKSDIWRYLFSSCFAEVHGRTPNLGDYPDALLPNHKNVDPGNKKNAKFIDRFKVQMPLKPATTVMSHISKDGHYYIHHDPAQCRAWTPREAARIQTFPDNYFFEGTKTEQYHQVGNAVPPRLAWQIAKVVARNMKDILNK